MSPLRTTFLITYPWDHIFREWATCIKFKYGHKLLKVVSRKISFKVTEFDFSILRCLP